jgi:hypothetical protein
VTKSPWAAFQSGQARRRRATQIGERVGSVLAGAATTYNELAPDGRRLSETEANRAREQIIALALCFREIHDDGEFIAAIAERDRLRGKDADLRPTISLMRMIQRGLLLALSDDPSRRRHAMPLDEMAKFAIPVANFWRDL